QYVHAERWNPGQAAEPAHLPPEVTARPRAPGGADEHERDARLAGERELLERAERVAAEVDRPRAAALRGAEAPPPVERVADPQRRRVDVDVVPRGGQRFADPDAGPRQDDEQGREPRGVLLRGPEESLDVGARHGAVA